MALTRFLRFLCVGAVGYAIDAGITMALTFEAGWLALAARLPAFFLATLVTYELNQRWTFAASVNHWRKGYVAYILAVGTGAGLNYAVYALVIEMQSVVTEMNIIAATMAGSVVALAFNYMAMRYGVFRHAAASVPRDIISRDRAQ